MITSEQINELAAALAKAQAAMSGAVKDSSNPFFKSKYADLASVWDACRGPLTANGLSVMQFPQTEYDGTPEIYEWQSRAGETRMGVKVLCTVHVVTRLLHVSGQWIEGSVSAMLASADPQAVGSAITYLRRYSLQSVVGVAPEDDDAEAAQERQPTRNATVQHELPPHGYVNWLHDIEAVVPEGFSALEAAWKASPPAFREYLTRTDRPKLDGMKKAAKAVNVKPVTA